MKWLATFLIAWTATAQPVDRLEDVTTADELITVIDEWMRGPMPDIQSITFDGEPIIVGGLAFDLDRNGAAYQRDGTSRAADEARYAPPQLLAGAPDWTDITSTASAWRPLCVDDNGGVMVVRQGAGATAHLDVHARTDPDAFYNAGGTAGTYRTSLGGTNGDLLSGQTGANSETAAIASHEFYPVGAYVYDGQVAVLCEHFINDGGWATRGVALAYNTIARLAAGHGWILAAVTEDINNTNAGQHGQGYTITGFEVGDDELYIGWADYSTDNKQGGLANLTRFVKSAGVWGAPEHIRLADNIRIADDLEHWHCVGYIVDASGNRHAIVSVGDSLDQNRMIHRSLSSAAAAAGNFGNGVTYSHPTYGATGIGGSYVIEEPHANWSSESVVWGGLAVSANHALRSNQLINFKQKDAACTTLLCGTDEVACGMYEMTWNATLGIPEFRVLYLPAATSGVGDGMVGFLVEGTVGGPFCARFSADAKSGAGWADQNAGGSGITQLESSILYSPDGNKWTHAASMHEPSQIGACPFAGKIYAGANASGQPGYFTIPNTRTTAPLQICSTPANVLSAGLSVASITTGGVNVTLTDLAADGSDLPPEFNGELPPCDRTLMFTINTGDATADRNYYFQGTISDSIPNTWTSLELEVWVRAIRPDGSTYLNQSDPSIYIDFQCVTGSVFATTGGMTIVTAGEWTPIRIYATQAQMSGAPATSQIRIRGRSVSLNNHTNPAHMAVCIGSLIVDGVASSAGTAPGSAALDETATISGFTPRESWSAYGEILIPDNDWDNRVGGGGTGTDAGTSMVSTIDLFRMQGVSADTFVFTADPKNNRFIASTDSASTNGTTGKAWFRRGQTVGVDVVCNGTTIIAYYRTEDNEVASITVADAITFSDIVGMDPIWWSRFIVIEGEDPDPEATLRTLAGTSPWQTAAGAGGRRTRDRDRRIR